LSGISSDKILTFLGPLFRYFKEVGFFTEEFKGKKLLLDLVGGAVRDHIINTDPRVQSALRSRGREHLIGKPIKDLDLSTNASPETVVALVRALANPSKYAASAASSKEAKWWEQWKNYKVNYIEGLGEQHGTVAFVFNYEGSGVEDQQIEITTHRSEEYDDEGRKPSKVTFSDEKDDAVNSRLKDSTRRDLAFNSMYMDEKGNVIDPHGGVQDLISGTLSIPRKEGESPYQAAMRVLKEDPLRFLRWIRFSGAYSAKPVPEILRALKDLKGTATVTLDDGSTMNLKDLNIASLVKERVAGNRKQVEISKIISHGGYTDGFKMMSDHGVYAHTFPNADSFHTAQGLLKNFEAAGIKGVAVLTALYYHQPVEHLKKDLGLNPKAGKSEARKSLNFSSQDLSTATSLLVAVQSFSAELSHHTDERLAKGLVDKLGGLAPLAIKMMTLAHPEATKRLAGLPSVIKGLGAHIKEDLSGLNYPPVTGADIIRETGLKGPAIKVVMDSLKEAFRRHDVDYEEAMSFVRHVANKIKSGSIDVNNMQLNHANYSDILSGFKTTKMASRVVRSYLSKINFY